MQQHEQFPTQDKTDNRTARFLSSISGFLCKKESFYYLIFLTFFVRLMFFHFWQIRTTSDSYAYIAQAEAILNGTPFSSFPNGYPLLIAGMILLTGKTQLYFGLLIINLVSQIITGIILYKTGLLLFRKNEGNFTEESARIFASLSLMIFAIYTSQVIFTNFLLTESLTTVLITASVYFLIRERYFSSGILLALASQLRTVYLPALLLVAITIFFINRKMFISYLSGAAFISVLIFGLDLFSVTAFPVNQSYNLLLAINIYNGKVVHDLNSFSSGDFAHPISAYLRYAVNNPWDFLQHRLNFLYELWGPYSFEPNNRILRVLFGTRFLLFISWIYMVYLIFIRREFKTGKILKNFLFTVSILVIVITIIHTIYFSGYRFIVPLEPVMILLTVMALKTFFDKRKLKVFP